MYCHNCKEKGHLAAACPKEKETESAKSGRVTVENVVVRRIQSKDVKDDYSKLPNMEGCIIEPIVYKNGVLIESPKATTMPICPDPGCEETLIAKNLVTRLGLFVDQTRKKRVQGITGGPSKPCMGSSDFQLTYMGQVINIRGLVTDVINNEIVLCLGALKRLGIVDAEYPKIRQNAEEQGVGRNGGEHQSARAMKTSVPVTVPGRT